MSSIRTYDGGKQISCNSRLRIKARNARHEIPSQLLPSVLKISVSGEPEIGKALFNIMRL
jgi:hypothetical protein